MEDRGEQPVFPPVSHRYLIDWWLDAGTTSSIGMGEGALTWQEIDAWVARTEIELQPWEARIIRRMSQAFANERHEAKKPLRPVPYSLTEQTTGVRDRVAAQFKAMAGRFRGRVDSGKASR